MKFRSIPTLCLFHSARRSQAFSFPTYSRLAFFSHFAVIPFVPYSSMSLFTANNQNPMADPMILLNSVYGPVDSPTFPLPMPEEEAGACADGDQRRYLWTDAFGVLAYVSIADFYESEGNYTESEKYRQAANILVDVVHKCLGSPRSGDKCDAMIPDASSPTGFVGLRIGKVLSREETDPGMIYDGMYFHYIDKWLLALARSNRIEEGIKIAKGCFPFFFDAGPDGSGPSGGIRWKLSINASPPRALKRAYASDDTLNALIVFSILEANRVNLSNDTPSLKNEIELLQRSLIGYSPRASSYDPLGWGLEVMFDQFIEDQPRWNTLALTHPIVLDEVHLSLPFRLYGALIGARIGGEKVAPTKKVDALIQVSKSREIEAISLGHSRREEHSSINRVMLAMCMLCPGALGRRSNDPLIMLQERKI
jgi:hypothetical protein